MSSLIETVDYEPSDLVRGSSDFGVGVKLDILSYSKFMNVGSF